MNGEEAVHAVNTNPPDLVLMDVQMPGMDGLEATRRIKADPRWRHIPIITLTALAMPGDRERCLSAGADGYFAKPSRLADVLALIRSQLEMTS
jgi:CheY-like chemotaxis protein